MSAAAQCLCAVESCSVPIRSRRVRSAGFRPRAVIHPRASRGVSRVTYQRGIVARASNNDDGKQLQAEGEGSLFEKSVELASSPLVYITVGAAVGVGIVSSGQDSPWVVGLLSLVPFVSVYYIGNSGFGEQLEAKLQEKLPALRAEAAAREQQRARVRAASRFFGEERPRVWGPLALPTAAHLTGELPGDYGFDPLGLSSDPAERERMVNLEILHARRGEREAWAREEWAMLGILGALVPEALANAGVDIAEPVWWKAGAAKANGQELNYLGVQGLHIAGAQGVALIAFCQLVLMAGPEYARYVGIKGLEPLGIFLPGDINYPGGALFDPLGLSNDAEDYESQRVKEVKNGRLAMFAFLGFAAQAAVTQKGPIANILDFVEDPARNNILGYIAGNK